MLSTLVGSSTGDSTTISLEDVNSSITTGLFSIDDVVVVVNFSTLVAVKILD